MTEQKPCRPCTNPCTTVDEGTEEQTRLAPMWRVLLHNDDVNDMFHVTRTLMRVFGFPSGKAVSIMMEAHHQGVALCAVEYLEHAEFHRDQLQAYSLTVTIEPED